jgi:oxygen-independent coproporphyrinogen-3 oxidase
LLSGDVGQLSAADLAKGQGFRPASQRGELDRWILSELNRTAAAIVEEEVISRDLEMAETVMLGLRLTAGVDLADFERRYGQPLESVFAGRLRDARAAGLVETAGGYLRLTEHGTLLGNEVFAALLPDAT